MAVVTSSPAWTLPSGQHQIILPTTRPALPPAAGTRPLLWTATGLTLVAAAAWFTYSHLGWERLVTLGQLAATLAGCSLLACWNLHSIRHQRAADLAAVHRHIRDALAEGLGAISGLGTIRDELHDLGQAVTAYRAALVDLPEQLRDRVDRQAVGYQALVAELGDRMAELAERVDAAERDRAELQNQLRQQAAVNRDLLGQVRRFGKEHTSLAMSVVNQLQAIEAATAQARERVEQAERDRDRLAREHADLAQAVRDQLRAIEAGAVEARKRAAAAEQDRERMAKEHIGFAKLVLQQLHGIGTGVGDLRERVDGTYRRLDELVETIEQVATAGAIVAAQVSGNGQVHQLRPPSPRRGR